MSQLDAPDELELETPGMTTAALAWGSEEGVPLLGLHGWLDNAATMAHVGPHLASHRFVAIDLPGHGRSGHRSEGQSYHFVDLIPAIFDAADALGWDQFSILGHSMGAAASFLAAGALPERIDRMVVVDGLGPWTTPADQTAEQLRKGLRERETLLEKTKRRFDERDQAITVLGEMYGLEHDEIRPLVERGLERTEEGDWQFSYDLLLRGSSLVRFTEPQVLNCMEQVEAPTLLIRPSEGWPVEGDLLESRVDAVESLTIREVEGGHHLHLQRPEKVAELATDFLDGTD